MRTEEEIEERIEWFEQEYDSIGETFVECLLAAKKYYLGAINSLKWVLESEVEDE